MTKLFLSSALFLFSIFCQAQSFEKESIDSVSIKLFQAFKENDLTLIEFHMVTKEDLKIVLATFEDQMNEKEKAEAEAELDSIPDKARKKWGKKYLTVKEEANHYIDNWDNTYYLSSDVETEIDKFTKMKLGKIIAKFEFANQTYGIKYDCIKMPRGWVLGNKLRFMVINEDN